MFYCSIGTPHCEEEADQQKDMLKKAEEDEPARMHKTFGWRTICTGKNDFSFFWGLNITIGKVDNNLSKYWQY